GPSPGDEIPCPRRRRPAQRGEDPLLRRKGTAPAREGLLTYCVRSSRDCLRPHDDRSHRGREACQVPETADAEPSMATFLSRLGRLAFRRRWYVALLWVAVLAAVGFGAATAPAAPDDSNSMPGIESQKAFDLMDQRFP